MSRLCAWSFLAIAAVLCASCLNLRRQYRESDASPDARDASSDITNDRSDDVDIDSSEAGLDALIDTAEDTSITDGTIDSFDSSVGDSGPDGGDGAVPPTCPPAFTDGPVFYPAASSSPTHFVCRNSMVPTSWTSAVGWCEQVGWRRFVPLDANESSALRSTICGGSCPAAGRLVPIALPATYIAINTLIDSTTCPAHLRFEPEGGSPDLYYRICLGGSSATDFEGNWYWDNGFPLSDSSSRAAVWAVFRSNASSWQNGEANPFQVFTIVCERP